MREREKEKREMTTTIRLVNIHYNIVINFFLMRLFKLLSNYQVHNTVLLINYSHHAAYYMLRTYLSYNWRFVPLTILPILPTPHISPLTTTNLFSVSMSSGCFLDSPYK